MMDLCLIVQSMRDDFLFSIYSSSVVTFIPDETF